MPRTLADDLPRLRAELRETQRLIAGSADRVRVQVAARQRDSAHRCALSRSVLDDAQHDRPG